MINKFLENLKIIVDAKLSQNAVKNHFVHVWKGRKYTMECACKGKCNNNIWVFFTLQLYLFFAINGNEIDQ